MFSILSIVKIEWKPEDVVLLKRSKKDIKNVDHMMINRDIATVREFMFCKVRVWKGYFCNWLRKNWPTLASSPHLTTFPQLNMSRLKSCPPCQPPLPIQSGEGGGNYGHLIMNSYWQKWNLMFVWFSSNLQVF